MKLTDLNPRWVGTGGEGVTRNGEPVPYRDKVAIEFDCPCGKECTPLCVPFHNPPDGGPGVYGNFGWQRAGETFEDLTLAPSILRKSHCGWHGFVTNGEISTC